MPTSGHNVKNYIFNFIHHKVAGNNDK